MNTNEIVHRLWNPCNVLRDSGIGNNEYDTELTYLLFLKMAKETGAARLGRFDCNRVFEPGGVHLGL